MQTGNDLTMRLERLNAEKLEAEAQLEQLQGSARGGRKGRAAKKYPPGGEHEDPRHIFFIIRI